MRVFTFVAMVGIGGLTATAGPDIVAYKVAVLGETEPFETRWDSIAYSGGARSPVPGDTYGASALLQDGISAFFIDEAPDSHTFGNLEAAGGNIVGNAGDSFSIVSLHTDLGGGQELVQVEMTNISANGVSSPWQPTFGLLSPNGVVYTSWRMDVGSTATSDDIAWNPANFTVVNSGFTLFDSSGASLGTFAMTVDTSTTTGISGVGVLGLGGGDIGGFDMASFQLFWEIKKIPASGCNDADLAEPFGSLDFSDVVAFLAAFGAMDPSADLAVPFGTFDFSDVVAFLSVFASGCP